MDVFLSPELEGFIRSEVRSGRYANAGEVVQDALRGLVARRRAAGQEAVVPPGKEEVRDEIAGMEKEIREMGVTSLGIFGSVARGEQGPGSDIDVAIEYDPDSRFSLLDLAGLKNLLEDRLGFTVDVVPRDSLEKAFGEEDLEIVERVF